MTKSKRRQPVQRVDVAVIGAEASGAGVTVAIRNAGSENGTKTIYPDVTEWSQEALTAFEAGRGDILVLERPALAVDTVEINSGHVHEYRASTTRRTIEGHVTCGLAEVGVGCEVLKRDIIRLAQSFLVQFRQQTLRLRIEIVNIQSCPKFHIDNVNMRLVTTYVGPTTEYQFIDDAAIHVTPLYGLVFLKGHKHPTHSDKALHRSPEMPPGTKRLCVAINF